MTDYKEEFRIKYRINVDNCDIMQIVNIDGSSSIIIFKKEDKALMRDFLASQLQIPTRAALLEQNKPNSPNKSNEAMNKALMLKKGPPSIDDLPDDILRCILKFLNKRQRIAIERDSRCKVSTHLNVNRMDIIGGDSDVVTKNAAKRLKSLQIEDKKSKSQEKRKRRKIIKKRQHSGKKKHKNPEKEVK